MLNQEEFQMTLSGLVNAYSGWLADSEVEGQFAGLLDQADQSCNDEQWEVLIAALHQHRENLMRERGIALSALPIIWEAPRSY
jgi:hypothetical protein